MVSFSLTPSRSRKTLAAPPTPRSRLMSPTPPPSSSQNSSEAFISYESVHVHLPAASSTSASSSKRIPHFHFPSVVEYDDSDIESGLAGSPTNDPEHAVSVSYLQEGGILARQLSNGKVLELRSLISETPHAVPTSSLIFRLTMPAHLQPFSPNSKVMYRHPVSGDLTIFLVDVHHTLFKLDFDSPEGRLRAGQDQIFSFDQDRMVAESLPVEFYRPTESQEELSGIVWEALDENTVVIGTEEGTGKCIWTGASWTFTHLKSPYKPSFRFFSSKATSDQVTSVSSYYPSDIEDPGAFVYSLSADRKLRSWSLVNNAHQWTVEDILSGISGVERNDRDGLVIRGTEGNGRDTPISSLMTGEDLGQTMMQTLPAMDSEGGHCVVVFTPTPRSMDSGGIFRVWKSITNGTEINEMYSMGFFTCSSETKGAELLGFHIEVVPGLSTLLNSGGEDDMITDERQGHGGSDRVWRLWTSWNAGGRSLTEWSNVSGIFEPQQNDVIDLVPVSEANSLSQGKTSQNPWKSVVSPLEGLEPVYDSAFFDAQFSVEDYDESEPFSDIATAFLEHLLYPGRYSIRSLEASLDEFIENIAEEDLQSLDLDQSRTLGSRIESVIGCNLHLDGVVDREDNEQVVHLRQELKLEWLGFLSRVQAEDRQSRWPLLLAPFEPSLEGSKMVVITREGFSLINKQDGMSYLAQLVKDLDSSDDDDALPSRNEQVNEFLDIQTGPLTPFYPVLASQKARVESLSILEASKTIAEIHGDEALHQFQTTLAESISDSVNEMSPIELATDLYLDLVNRGSADGDAVKRVLSALRAQGSVAKSIETLLRQMCLLDGRALTTATSPGNFTFSGFSSKLAEFSQVVRVRYRLITRLLVLVCAWQSMSDSIDEEDDLLELTAKTLVTYQYYSGLNWLVARDGERESNEDAEDPDSSLDINFDTLGLGNGFKKITSSEVTYSLLHGTLSTLRSSQLASDSSSLFSQIINPTSIAVTKDSLIPSASETKLAHQIYLAGFAQAAGLYAGGFPDAPGMLYVFSEAAASRRQIEDAVRGFEHVAATISSCGANVEDLASVLPQGIRQGDLASYYRHVSDIFDALHETVPMIQFAQFALQETNSPDDPINEELYGKLFRTYLQLHMYDEAFATMVKNPFIDHSDEHTGRDRPLGNLIHAMCTNDAVPQLLELPFSGIEHLVESELTFKARNSDPTASPDYYRVLYSWYISKTDFRNAAIVQYQQGRRLASHMVNASPEEYQTWLASQAQSYLASLQAFSLIDPKNAWAVVSVPRGGGVGSLSHQNQRMTSYIPLSELSTTAKPSDFVTIDDVRREYNLLLSQLKVAHHYEGELDPLAPLSAIDCVGYFSNVGLYDDAFMTARSQEISMSEVFESVTQRCMEIERFEAYARTSGADVDDDELDIASWLESSPTSSSWSGSLSDRAWRYLQVNLSRHDTLSSSSSGSQSHCPNRYHLTVLSKMLRFDPSHPLPSWLLSPLLSSSSSQAPLLRLLSRSHSLIQIEQALDLSNAILRGIEKDAYKVGEGVNEKVREEVYDALRDLAQKAKSMKTRNVQGHVKMLGEKLEQELTRHLKTMEMLQKR